MSGVYDASMPSAIGVLGVLLTACSSTYAIKLDGDVFGSASKAGIYVGPEAPPALVTAGGTLAPLGDATVSLSVVHHRTWKLRRHERRCRRGGRLPRERTGPRERGAAGPRGAESPSSCASSSCSTRFAERVDPDLADGQDDLAVSAIALGVSERFVHALERVRGLDFGAQGAVRD